MVVEFSVNILILKELIRKFTRVSLAVRCEANGTGGMFFNFIDELRTAGIKASFKEHLVLLEALDKDVIEQTPEQFYYLSRSIFVKDEGLLDRFDQVFNQVFKGLLTS